MASRRSAILAAAGMTGAMRAAQRLFWQRHPIQRRVSAKRLDALAGEILAAAPTDLDQLGDAWRRVVPLAHRSHSAVEKLHRGTLTVVVDSAATRYVLNGLCGATILPALAKELGDARVRRIVFRVGPIQRGKRAASEPRSRSK